MPAEDFEDANAACSLLPGPTSTQLAILCGLRVAGARGALIGGLVFILPAVGLVLGLSALFLAGSAPVALRGAAAGAGAAVAAVAVRAAFDLARPSLARARDGGAGAMWYAYIAAGAGVAALAGTEVVIVLLLCGLLELARRERTALTPLALIPAVAHPPGLIPLAWTALKVGALSFGGGFVIVPLMQGDAVHVHHWMTSGQFLTAVALGQVTPGPVVATVAGVGYAVRGWGGGLLAAAVAFAPSFIFVLAGGPRFSELRGSRRARAFLDGAGPAAIGAILGTAAPLARALHEGWQLGLLAGAALVLLALRRSVVVTLLAAGAIGASIGALGGPLPG